MWIMEDLAAIRDRDLIARNPDYILQRSESWRTTFHIGAAAAQLKAES